MIRILPFFAILLFGAAISYTTILLESNARIVPSSRSADATQRTRNATLRADLGCDSDTPVELVGDHKPIANDALVNPATNGDSVTPSFQPIRGIPLSEVHDQFYAQGDVFIGRSASRSNSTRRSTAPRMQANPFAQ